VDKVRNAFEILVRNATEEFGFAARDVFNGVLRLPRARVRHARGVEKLGYDQLRELVLGLPRDCGSKSQFSDIVVVVYPRPSTSLSNYDDWVTDFKSIRIAKEAVEWLRLQGHGRLREMYNLFHRIPECSSLAGWVFEAIVHRMFVAGWQAPQPILMASDGGNPPVFSTDSPSSTSGTFLLPFAPLSAGTRAFTRVDFNDRRLSGVTLEPNTYYVPTVATNPLFDSFIIDRVSQTVVISIIQITASGMHEGSGKGYINIRKIMSCVRKLLKEEGSNATVQVAYCLVCPDDRSQHKWKMPVGWDKCTKFNNHCGDGFYIRIPSRDIMVRRVYSLPRNATELNHG
jgi:hypothetical protein